MLQNKNSYTFNAFGSPDGPTKYAYNGYASPGASMCTPSSKVADTDNTPVSPWNQSTLKTLDYAPSIWDQALPSPHTNANTPTYFSPTDHDGIAAKSPSGINTAHDPLQIGSNTNLLPRSFLNGDGEIDFSGPDNLTYRLRSSYASPSSNQMSMANPLHAYTRRTSCMTVRSDSDPGERDISRLRSELAVKEQVIKSLTGEMEAMKEARRILLFSLGKHQFDDSPGSLTLPEDYKQLFLDTYKVLQKTKTDLTQTKDMLEAILVGIAMGGGQGLPTNSGQHDPQELGHKIVTKINMLQNENDNLFRMLSLGNRQGLLAEIAALREQRDTLKKKK